MGGNASFLRKKKAAKKPAPKKAAPKKAKPALKEIAKKVKEVITSKDSAEKKKEE